MGMDHRREYPVFCNPARLRFDFHFTAHNKAVFLFVQAADAVA